MKKYRPPRKKITQVFIQSKIGRLTEEKGFPSANKVIISGRDPFYEEIAFEGGYFSECWGGQQRILGFVMAFLVCGAKAWNKKLY